MNKTEIKELWKKHELSCRNSYSPEYIKGLCKDFGVEWNEDLVFTKLRYRELANENTPRVDALDFLELIAKTHKLEQDPKHLATANRMHGEGSRRQSLEESWLGRDD